MTDAPSRLLLHRRLFLWSHGVLAFFSMIVYLHEVVPSLRLALNFRPSGTRNLIIFAFPALWPYLASAAMSWQFISEQRLGFYLFLTALIISGTLSMALALGAFGFVTDRESLLLVYYYQTGAHFLISWLLDIEAPSNNRWRGP